ncbi:MAG: hypothetical protein CM1200mP27_06450 [Chloroflexota bacterium]|nr:MAG: hypothetical protein CM1200mP27_06450 [Chloroflexota bacterium]
MHMGTKYTPRTRRESGVNRVTDTRGLGSVCSLLQDGKFWQIAIPSALGAAFAVILLYGLLWGYRPNLGLNQPVAGKPRG